MKSDGIVEPLKRRIVRAIQLSCRTVAHASTEQLASLDAQLSRETAGTYAILQNTLTAGPNYALSLTIDLATSTTTLSAAPVSATAGTTITLIGRAIRDKREAEWLVERIRERLAVS